MNDDTKIVANDVSSTVQTCIPKAVRLWNSLEISKLIVQALIPFAIFVFSIVQTQISTKDARQAEYVRREVEKRYKIWDAVSPDLNQVYAYFLYVGDWDQISPTDVIRKKHNLDNTIYANKIFLSEDFFQAFRNFENAAFVSYREFEKPPIFMTVKNRPLDNQGGDAIPFKGCDNGDAVYQAYWALMDISVKELSLPPDFKRPQMRPDFPNLAKKDMPPCGTAR